MSLSARNQGEAQSLAGKNKGKKFSWGRKEIEKKEGDNHETLSQRVAFKLKPYLGKHYT